MRSLVLPVLAAVAAISLPACNKPKGGGTVGPAPGLPPGISALVPGDVVTTQGVHEQTSGAKRSKLTIESSATAVRWVIETSSREGTISSVGEMQRKDPADPWFAYMEDTGRFWFFNGRDYLVRTITDEGVNQGNMAVAEGVLVPEGPTPPAEVIQRLPEKLRELYPEVKAPTGRPSI